MTDKKAIGIDIGGTNLKAGIISEGRIVEQLAEKTPSNLSDLLLRLSALRQQLSGQEECLATGLALPALLNYQERKVISAPNLSFLDGLDFDMFEDMAVGNDVDMALSGEIAADPSLSAKNVLVVNIGTGLGSALYYHQRGSFEDSFSCELGHMKIVPGGKECQCGGRGCLEAYCSGHALLEQAAEIFGPDIKEAAEIFQLAEESNEKALGIVDSFSNYLGLGIANLLNCIAIDTVIIGGKIGNSFDLFKEKLAESVEKNTFGYSQRRINIVKSNIVDQASIIGSAVFALNQ